MGAKLTRVGSMMVNFMYQHEGCYCMKLIFKSVNFYILFVMWVGLI